MDLSKIKLRTIRLKSSALITVLAVILVATISMKAQNVASPKEGLDPKAKSIIIISSLTAQGEILELKKELGGRLDAGLTVNEIKEVLVHTYGYRGCGQGRGN